MKQKKIKNLPAITRTAEGLRDALFDELNLLREGRTTAVKARAIALLASQIIDSIRVQIQHGRLIEDGKQAAGLLLGTTES